MSRIRFNTHRLAKQRTRRFIKLRCPVRRVSSRCNCSRGVYTCDTQGRLWEHVRKISGARWRVTSYQLTLERCTREDTTVGTCRSGQARHCLFSLDNYHLWSEHASCRLEFGLVLDDCLLYKMPGHENGLFNLFSVTLYSNPRLLPHRPSPNSLTHSRSPGSWDQASIWLIINLYLLIDEKRCTLSIYKML
jgi:hypothetical protein